MARPRKYSPEVRERAVRMVREHGPSTLTWVDWFNTRWLMEPTGLRPIAAASA